MGHELKNQNLLALSILILIILGIGFLMKFTPLGSVLELALMERGAGSFDRERFESIVKQVRASGITAGQSKKFILDDLSNPMTLRELTPAEASNRSEAIANVWGEMKSDGKLKVVIKTKDLGHGGVFGFAYSEAPFSATPMGDGRVHLDVPEINWTEPGMKIDDNWWEVAIW